MNNWKINKTVDLAHGIDGVEVWPHALLVTGDKNAHEWNVTVMDNGNEASLSGVIEAYFVRSDGSTVTASGSVAGNVATVTLPEACYAYEGDLQAVMQLIQDDVSVTLSALLLRVRQITTDVIIDPGTEIPSLDDLLAQIENMKQATKDAGEATSKANTAAGNADAATEKANASAAAADASKEAADTAANAANEAADRANKAASGVGIRKKIVDALPAKTEMEQDVLYLVRRAEPNAENVYDEYMLINGEVEAIGSTKTDLEDYATKDYVNDQDIANLISRRQEAWANASCNANTGDFTAYASDRIRTSSHEYGVRLTPGAEYVVSRYANPSTYAYEMVIYFYEENNAFIGAGKSYTAWIQEFPFRFIAPDNVHHCIIGIRHSDNSEISISEAVDHTLFRLWCPAVEDLATKDYVNEQIDAIEIGGRNYWSITNQRLEAYTKFDNDTGIYSMSDNDTASTLQIKLQQCYGGVSSVKKTDSVKINGNGIYSIVTNIVNGVNVFRFANVGVVREFDIRHNIPSDFQEGDQIILIFEILDATLGHVQMRNIALYKGDISTDWTPSPDDLATKEYVSRRATVTYDYGGRNLKDVFGTAEALHNALAAEDYSRIAVGDYWPITLNGTFWDYGSYTVKSGVPYYSNNTLQANSGTTTATYEGTYVSDTAVSFSLSGTTYYVAVGDCLPYFERTCNNVAVKLEVAGINHYWRYCDRGELAGSKPHIVFVSRDGLPFMLRMRKGETKWEDASTTNPWIGSAMFKTLNDETHGVLQLVAETDIGAYIYAGPNNKGMRALLDKKAPGDANATGWAIYDRGKLFLPSAAEVWGHPFWGDMNRDGGLGNQIAIFRNSRRHISKGNGDSGSRFRWWLSSSGGGSHFAYVSDDTVASDLNPAEKMTVPVCFVFV